MLKVIDYLKKEKSNSEVPEILEKVQHIEQAQRFFELKRYRRFDSDDEREKNAELFSAIRNGDLKKVEELRKAGVKFDIIDKNNKDNTPLHYAVEKDKKEIAEKLLQEWEADINAKNNRDDTPLHIAVSKGKKELIRLLLNKNAEVNTENKDGKTPLDIAKSSTYQNKEEIIKILEKNLKNIIKSSQEKEVHDKLRKFAEDFVFIYERSLSEYYERLERQVPKSGKWASLANEVIEVGKSGTEGIEIAEVKAPSMVGINILQKVISSIGSKHNREELKKLIDQLYTFKKDPGKVREELVKSGVEIFQSFESQFVQVTADGSWQRAMTKLAEDAVGRVVDYHRKNTEEEFSASSISKGVIFGKSKTYKHISTGIPHIKPGHTLEGKNSNLWNTAKLFDKAGLVTIKKDGTADKYYKRKGEKSDTSKYGYRLLFKWESEDRAGLTKKLNVEYQEARPTGKEYKYILKSDEKLKNALLSEINSQDPKLVEERLVENFQEVIDQVKQNAEENFNELESYIDRNFSELSSYIENNQNEIKKIFSKVVRHHQEASQQRQEISHSVEEGRKENREGFQEASQKRQEIADDNKKEHEKTRQAINKLTEVVVAQNSVEKKVPILFDVREPVTSFTGREEQLDEIANNIKQGVIIIGGLGGVGKSELAIKYAHNHYGKEDSVIWINAETRETAKNSFRRLLKELKLKTRDQDGDEKSVGLMAKEVYNFFAGKESLFIFDNAKEHSIIKEFLPLSASGCHVLITSQNFQLFNEQEHGKIKRLSLDTLPEDKAVEFVKKALNINNSLQDKKIKELVETLGYLPLALQHAVAHIKESGYVESIGKYVEIYKKSEQEIQSFLKREGLSNYDKTIFLTFRTTIDKVKQEENGKLAEEILNTIAYFASDNIRKETFFKLAQDRVEESNASIKNDRANGMLTRAINLLGKYSIINLKEEQVSIHRLVQEVIRSELKKQSEKGRVLEEEVLEKALGLLKEYIKVSPGNAASCIPHIISIWDYASKYDELIKSFIVDSTNNKATTSTTYFDLIIEGSNYEVIDAIIKKISSDNLKEVINAKNKDNVTPLHKAVLRNDEKIVKLLIDEGADVNVKKSNGWTPLHLAAKNGNLEVVNALLKKGANVDDKTSSKYQFIPLHLAARNGYKEVVEALLASNANVNAKTGYEFTPLHLAAGNGHIDVVQALLKNDQIIINAETKDKFTPLHLAAKSGHLSVIEALLAKSADINAQNKDGFTLLHLAALNGYAKIINKLLENYKVNIDARTTNGNTPLHLAAEKGHLEIVKALIAKNADIDIKNGDGNTASDLAHSEVKDYILSIYKRTKGAAGIEGQLCEINLSMLLLLKGVTDERIGDFHLASNMEKADKFDDIVFKYEYREGIIEKSKIIFLQAKHKTDQKGVNIDSLLSDSESGDFSLKKYFISYRKIKQQFSETKGPVFSSKFEDSEFIIYTNAPFSSGTDSSIKKENIDRNDFLRISDSQSEYYQLEFNSDKKERIVNPLKDSSDSRRLAKELVQSISSGKGIDMQKDIFQSYHIALQGKVIEKIDDKLEGKLSDNFLSDDGSLSSGDKEFRRVFLEEAGKVFKKQGSELKQELQNKVIKLSNKFGINSGSENLALPNDDPVAEDEIKDFLNKFKLFASQPSEKDLEKLIKDKVKEVYRVEQQDIDSVFSNVEYKVKKWWQSGNAYLKKDNKFFEDAARVSINFDVKEPVTLFTGRTEELSDLHSRIQCSSEKVTVISQMTSISGLGGIGKTELSRQYIQENSKDYDNNVIWINAESEATLIESFRRLAQDKLRISTKNADGKEKDIKSIVGEVYKFFNKRRSLFIFDNAEKNDEFKGFLPMYALSSSDNKPYILITSRNREWEKGIEVMDLNELKLEDAVEFVKKGLGIEDESQNQEIKALVEKLQRFPLAIQQAIAYIEDQRVTGEFSIDNYLKEYEKKTEDLLNSEVFKGIDNDYARTTFTTWEITIDKIKGDKEHGKLALEVLNAIAYFAPENINREMFLEFAESDEAKLKPAVRLLVKYSMINGEKKQSILSIHRLVQQITRIKLERSNKEREVLREALTLLKKTMEEENNLGSEYTSHAVSAWGYASKCKELVEEFSKLPSDIAKKLLNNGRYVEANSFAAEALELLKGELGLDNKSTLSIQHYMAMILDKQSKYREAWDIFKDVLQKRKEILGSDDPETLETWYSLAWTLDHLSLKSSEYEESLEMFREILKKREKVLGKDHSDTLDTQDRIGWILVNQSKYKEARDIFEDVLEKKKKILGLEDVGTLSTMHNVAVVLSKQGEHDKALKTFSYVYEKRKEKLGNDHPYILNDLHHIATELVYQGKLQEALNTLEDALEKRKKILGKDHPETLNSLGMKAIILTKQGNYQEALKIYDSEDFSKLKKSLPHHFDLITQLEIAKTLEDLGRNQDALNMYRSVFEKSRETLGEGHSNTRKVKDIIDRLSQLQLRSSGDEQIDEISVEECLSIVSSGRSKREAENGCLFIWEDVDEFNTEKNEKRDFSKIKIDGEKFVDYIKDLSEGKRNQLIQLADEVKVVGNSQDFVSKLISNQKVINHLNRVGKISGMMMHSMMAKNVLADFLNRDYQGVAINVGFIAGGQGFAKVAEAASLKGLKLASEGKLLLGRSLRAASPFLARGTSAFVVYDLVNQVKAFKNGTEEALVGVVGDSIYLGVDAAEIGIEIAEAFEVLEGVSSVTGPIGATIGAVVFVGTDVYMAVKRVDKIDQLIHLTGKEKFIEGLRAFIGMQPENHIQELLQEKEVSNELVRQGFEYLKEHSDIQSYVFPTGKSVVDSCRKVPYQVSDCASGGFGGGCLRAKTITRYAEECTTKFEVDLDSTVLLDRKRTDIKWSRARPDDPSGGKLFCLPKGDYQLAPSDGSYLCESAIGLSANTTSDHTLISLGEGRDYVKGFLNSPNIFVVNNGSKEYYGGNKEDVFVLQADYIKGHLSGQGGINTLDTTSFAFQEEPLNIQLHIGEISDFFRDNWLKVCEINKVLGRENKAEMITVSCDGCNSNVKLIDGQSGNEKVKDEIKIIDDSCSYQMQIIVRPNTVVYNRALEGNFDYVVPLNSSGSAELSFIYGPERFNVNNTFWFAYEPVDIKSIDVKYINVFNRTKHEVKFNFVESDKEFNVTISYSENPSYRLGNNGEIRIGNKDNLYMLQSRNESAEEIIKNYLPIANRLNKMSFFIQSVLSNETVVIGSGNHEVIHNNPVYKSHLVGNGGENVYVIDSEIDNVPEVIIHDVDEENSIDTIDLRNVVKKARGSFELQVIKSENDLLLRATVGKHEYCTVRLKDGIERYNKTHVIVENAPMIISVDKNEWSLKPQPLMFEKDKEIIVVTGLDVEKGTELITPKKGGNYMFVRSNGNDLIITNAFDSTITKDDLCSITLSKFYEVPKMKTLSIKFADKEIVLKDHQEEISAARDVNIVKKEHKDQVYSDVFNRSPEVIDQPVTHRHEHHIRNRRSEYTMSSGTRTSSWINDLFGWVKSSIGGLFDSRAALPEEKLNTKSSISPIDVNGTIMLLDVIVRKFTGKQYIPAVDESIPLLEARGYALNITNRFEKVLNKTAVKSGISLTNLNFDPLAVQSAIIGKIINGRSSDEIAKTLYSIAKEACPEFKQTDKFLDNLKSNLLAKEETMILQEKVEKPSKVLGQEVLRKVQLSKKPNTFLNGTSVIQGINRAIN